MIDTMDLIGQPIQFSHEASGDLVNAKNIPLLVFGQKHDGL
jgi:hypothetical protein